jgi:hypothetical protein
MVVGMSALISTSVLSPLPEGLYPVAVEAQDDLGNWGEPGMITMTLDKTGPDAPIVTLTPDYLDLTQPLTVTSIRLDAVMTDALSSGVQSTIANAEAFVDATGPTGDGFDLIPKDGLFDEISEAAYFDMPVAHFSMLAEGVHTVNVYGLDAAGNWGTLGQAEILIDRGGGPPADTTGPDVTVPVANPNPTLGATIVTLTATATDPGSESNIASAEYFINGDPGVGLGFPMQAADGAFDSPSEALTGDIDVSGWPNVGFRLYVRAQDTAGNWGAARFVRLQVSGNLGNVILNDGFETGSLAAWSEVVGAVSVVSQAAVAPDAGAMGLQAALDGSPAYLSHWMPPGEVSYRASFYFDPSGADLATDQHGIFVGLDRTKSIFGIQVEASGAADGGYEVRGWALSQGAPAYTAWHELDAGAHQLGLRWRAMGPSFFGLVVDGVVVDELPALDARGYTLYEVRLGPSSNLDTGISGVEYFDGFEARRTLFAYLPIVH